MKLNKKASLLVVALLMGSLVVGCNQKLDYDKVKENTPVLIHEDLQKEVEALDGEDILNMYFINGLFQSEELSLKDEISDFESTLTSKELEVLHKYNELYAMTTLGAQDPNVKNNITKAFNDDVISFLNKVYLDEGEVDITTSFEELKPAETMQKYLKENKIEVTSLSINDEFEVDFARYPFVAPLTYVIEGKIGKESFSETVTQTFFFSPEDKDVLEKNPVDVNFLLDGLQ